jgi:hypothetical protein
VTAGGTDVEVMGWVWTCVCVVVCRIVWSAAVVVIVEMDVSAKGEKAHQMS